MLVSLVVAVSSNGVIGRGGELPWYIPADLARFRTITMGKPIVMGRRTHESIGRPLPGRENIVVSSNPKYSAEGCRVISGLDEIDRALPRAREIMIIGGARLYAESLPGARRIYMTEVHAELDGDVHFPDYDRDSWLEVERETHHADAKNEYDYSFVVLQRQPG